MKLGAEPKKVAILAGLMSVALYLIFSGGVMEEGGGRRATRRQPSRRVQPVSTSTARTVQKTPVRLKSTRGRVQKFRPSLKPRRPEDRPDPMTIDPTLRLDLLEKLRQVKIDQVTRSLFEFSSAPPVKTKEPKLAPEQLAKIKARQKLAAAAAASRKKTKPAPPPIPLKFYGYINPVQTGNKKVFFLNGEDILVAKEGDVIGKYYKVVRIRANSVIVEDTRHKHRQTLRLEEQKG